MTSIYRPKLLLKPLLIGCLLPDLIDKPLYLTMVLITGRHGQEIGLISGTRTFGHTFLFLLALSVLYTINRSETALALLLGTATHLFLDFFSKLEVSVAKAFQYVDFVLLWPLNGRHFPGQDFKVIDSWRDLIPLPLVLVCEVIGLWILVRNYSKGEWKTELSKKDRQLE